MAGRSAWSPQDSRLVGWSNCFKQHKVRLVWSRLWSLAGLAMERWWWWPGEFDCRGRAGVAHWIWYTSDSVGQQEMESRLPSLLHTTKWTSQMVLLQKWSFLFYFILQILKFFSVAFATWKLFHVVTTCAAMAHRKRSFLTLDNCVRRTEPDWCDRT